MTFDDVVGQVTALPEVESRAHFDQPAYRLRGKILVTLRHDAAGRPVAVLKPPVDEINAVLAADPTTFALASSGWLVVQLDRVDPDEMHELLAETWLKLAPKRLAAEHRQALLGAPDRPGDQQSLIPTRIGENRFHTAELARWHRGARRPRPTSWPPGLIARFCLVFCIPVCTDSGIFAEMDARSAPGLNDPLEEAIDDALSSLPTDLRAAMSNVEIVVEDEPPDGQPLLGLYRGVPLPRRSSTYSGVLPDKISIFRGPITRLAAGNADRLRREVRHVVLHEIAHHFGISDERLIELDRY